MRPAYKGLIEQLDISSAACSTPEEARPLDDTLIVFTSDHGDFLGDHWLGEKELFYDKIQRVPLIVVRSRSRRRRDARHGRERFVEASTWCRPVSTRSASPAPHRIEGRSLLPLLRGGKVEPWRDAVFSELDYFFREARKILKRGPRDCRAIMVRTDRWKYVWWQDFRPMLFDLANDPKELRDLGADNAHAHIRLEMEERMAAWLKARKTRVTVDDAYVEARTATHKKHGIFFGVRRYGSAGLGPLHDSERAGCARSGRRRHERARGPRFRCPIYFCGTA